VNLPDSCIPALPRAVSSSPSPNFALTSEHERTRWFAEEVQAHEAPLRAYLRRSFPWLRDVDDLIQESFARLWRACRRGHVRSGRAFLYATARHAALDLNRHQQVLSIDSVGDLAELTIFEDGPDAAEASSRNQEFEILAEAIRSLPDRCRQVLTLKKIHELSQKDIASRLGISEHTVEVQVANGMRRCAHYLRDRGVIGPPKYG
jgi:RNA polymerase sigma factor, sigma-70 family